MNADKSIVFDWIEKADHDLGSAKLIYLHIPEYFDTVAFHCQQATEKYLKAILLFEGIEFERTHNLIYLLELLSQKIEITDEFYDKAILLNGFSVQIRYPDHKIYMTADELETSINIAQEFREFAIKIIGILE
jgi:HEPN domain-containing protein